jgi:hypothetical protein
MLAACLLAGCAVRIQANDRLVLCTSFGILEKKLLTALEKELGAKTIP